ncbi:hypothetical protein QBC47DRAFT_403629 [Echria macrotheca]|uniref:Ubiquitin-like domain-containing protein n=1 Tax=Echria macrotheca TaxID=438768 RepID=A0AAJ0FAH2_9PEZI|nr:hypothetical protein QBC47DRAFT_403629 [Echria macrotheca]
MAVSFGSVGDIIAVCLLVKDLVDTLDNSRGSRAQYQDLLRELGSLERCLLQVDLLTRSSTSPDILAICETAKLTVADCQTALDSLSTRMQKYDRYLGHSRPQSGAFLAHARPVVDAAMKVRWQISEKDKIEEFRQKITAHTNVLNMLLATAQLKLSEKNADKMDSMQATWNAEVTGALTRVERRLDENTTRISEAKSMLAHISGSISWIRDFCSKMQASVDTLLSVGRQVHAGVMQIQQAQLSPLMERLLTDEPFVLEDAIGRRAPVHLQFINSWDALHAVLEARFRDIQGADKVSRNEYSFQDRATGREVVRTRPWEGAFLPGQRVDMSFVFERYRSCEKTAEETVNVNSCPRCRKTVATRSLEIQVEW